MSTYARVLVVILLLSLLANGFSLFVIKKLYAETKIIRASFSSHERYAVNNDIDLMSNSIVIFGDSRVAEWGRPQLEESLVINRGITAETSEQMTLRFASDVLSLEPEYLVLQLGVNDLVAASLAPSNKARDISARLLINTQEFIEDASAANIKVIYLPIFPAKMGVIRKFLMPSLPNRITAFNADMRSWLVSKDMCVLGMDKFHTLESDYLDYARDALHIRKAGYQVLNGIVEETMEGCWGNVIQ